MPSRSLRRGMNFCATDEEPAVRDQLAGTMFDLPASRAGALPTSAKAARTAALRSDSIAAQVLARYAAAARPLTPDQVADFLGRDVLSVRPRASQALRRGYLRATGQEVPTEHGGEATALEITDLGKRTVVSRLRLLGGDPPRSAA